MVGQAVTWEDVAIVVPSVASREGMAISLASALVEQCPGAEIRLRVHVAGESVKDDFPKAIRYALQAGRRWILQLEDDVELCPGFGWRALEAIQHCEDKSWPAASLFSRRGEDITRLHGGQRWYPVPGGAHVMNQAIVLLADSMVGFYEWAPSWYEIHQEHTHAADLLLGAWLSRSKHKMMVHVPSLVQHRPVPSTLGPRSKYRTSKTFDIAWRR